MYMYRYIRIYLYMCVYKQCFEFHAKIVEQVYLGFANTLQITRGKDGMVGWFTAEFPAPPDNPE